MPRSREARQRAADNRKERLRTDPEYRAHKQRSFREWYARTREKQRAVARARAARNRDADRAYRRRRYAEDPKKILDRYKRWRAANIEKARAYQRACDERRRGAPGDFSAKEWLDLVAQFGGRCAYCGAQSPLEADHRIPVSRGGTNYIENILPSCVRCNRRKFNMTETEFRILLAYEAATGHDTSVRERQEPTQRVVDMGIRGDYSGTSIST